MESRLQNAERWLESISDKGERPKDMIVVNEDEFRRLPGAIALYHAGLSLARGDVPETLRYARRVLDLVPEEDHLGRGGASGLMGLALWTKGDLETAHWMFAEGMAQLQMAGNISDAVGGVLALSDIRIAQGHLRDAMHTYERALQLARENGTSMLRGTADMYVGMSELEREHNDLQAAMQLLLRSQEQGEHTGFPQHPYRWRVAMARIREAQGVLNGALELLQEAEPLYVSDFFPNVHPISALKARLWIAQGRLAEALSWPRQARSKRSLTGATHSKRWSRRTAMSPRDTNRATSSSLWSRRMSSQHNPDRDTGTTSVYQIRIRGHLGPQWRNWFDGLAITLEENGDTLLTGRVMDQAALHGLLKKVRDLGIPLRSVNTVDPNQADID